MPIMQSPSSRILGRMLEIAKATDIGAALGLTSISARHERNRRATIGERPAMSLRLVKIELDPDRQVVHTSSEVCWQMTVDIVIDMELPKEGEDVDGDDTGWNNVTVAANAYAALFIAEGSSIRGLVDDVIYGDIDPDEDSTPDNGRLAQSVIVLYRTLWNDPNHLLAPEENGL